MKWKLRLQRMCAWTLACVLLLSLVLFLPANARADQGIVRVLLTRLELTDRLTASLDGSYTLSGLSFQRGSELTFSCASGQIIVYYEGMALSAGREVALTRHAVSDGKENGLRLNGGYSLYCGDLHLTTDGHMLTAVLYIPVEEYLLGVVPYEMNEAFPLEALKAQAVAARTYALRKAGSAGAYDLVDNTNDQVYRGYQKENVNAAQAVAETEGVCGYDGDTLAMCYYTASNGGQIELAKNVWGEGEGAYITMHDDPYDLENPESPVQSSELAKKPTDGILGNAAFTEAVKLLLTEPLTALGFTGEAEDIRIVALLGAEVHTPTGGAASRVMTKLRLRLRVAAKRLAAQDDADDEEMSIFQMFSATTTPAPQQTAPVYETVEQEIVIDVPIFSCAEPLLGLSINGSDNEIITVTETESAFVLESRRFGHGVGMSQRGAQWMAGEYGWTYEQILRFYYPGLTFRKADTQVALPSPVAADFLATPGPAATPTPRPTLMPATAQLKEGEWRVKVTGISMNSSLNMRSGPSTGAEILRVLYYGQELIVIESMPDGWLHVKTDVLEGYVMEKFVEKVE